VEGWENIAKGLRRFYQSQRRLLDKTHRLIEQKGPYTSFFSLESQTPGIQEASPISRQTLPINSITPFALVRTLLRYRTNMGIGSHNMTLSASREPGHPVAGFR
jgi:hypothetical protein